MKQGQRGEQKKLLKVHVRTKKRRVKSLYIRFALSLFLMLFLPLLVFILIFNQYYSKIYREKIIEQAEKTLEAVGMEVSRGVESLHRIVSEDTAFSTMSELICSKDYLYIEVRNNLKAKQLNHGLLKNICYYNVVRPDMIYTDEGTWSLSNYAEFYAGLTDKYELLSQLQDINRAGWLHWGDGENGNLQFVIRKYPNEWWIFTLDNKELSSILEDSNSFTQMQNPEGEVLCQTGDSTVSVEYEISFSPEDGAFRLVRHIYEESLFAEFYTYQKIFQVVVLIVSFVGGAMVFLLTWLNEHPIRETQLWIKSKLKHIPNTVEGMEIFRYAFDEMENQLAHSEKTHRRNRLLLSLLYGYDCDTERFHHELQEAGLFLKGEFFRVVLAASVDKEAVRDKICLYLKQQMLSAYEICVLETDSRDAVIMIVCMEKKSDQGLKSELLIMEEILWRNAGCEVCFYVGSLCKGLKNIHLSYTQASMCQRLEKQKNHASHFGAENKVIFYEKERKDKHQYRYPQNELKNLEDSLEEADLRKVTEITDQMIELLRENQLDRFSSYCLYYDVLNAFYRVQSRLEIDEDFELFEIGLLEANDSMNAIQIILSVREQYQAFIEQIRRDSPGIRNADSRSERVDTEELVCQVISYIENSEDIGELNVSLIADHFDLSISLLSQKFKKHTGYFLSEYITQKKFSYAGKLLKETDKSVKEISLIIGYSSPISFIRKFKSLYGMTPVNWRMKEK